MDIDEPNYSLSVMHNKTITGVRVLSESEYGYYINCIDALEKFSQDEQLFQLVQLNYEELLSKISFYTELYIKNQRMDFERFTSQYIDINRLMLNLLSSKRTYMDHTEARFKRLYGVDSFEYSVFDYYKKEIYDNNFSYKFLYKLRNYSQHCGLPAGAMNFSSSTAEGCSLSVMFHRESLLDEYKSWGVAKDELERQSEKFDILPLINESISLLKTMHINISDFLLSKLTSEAEILLSLIIEAANAKQGKPMILCISGSEERPNINIKDFPYKIISRATAVEITISPPAD